MNNRIKVILLLISISFFSFSQVPAFPGAGGGGMFSSGGRGGKVIYVTSLLDDAKTEGTFRWAVSQKGTRIVLFKVSGIIQLKSSLKIKNGDLTIAGQSAPGDGICIAGFPVIIGADNVIVRFMRFRMGDENAIQDDAFKGNASKNVIIDHCSISWSTDESASFYSNENFTLQFCIISESLRNSVHKKGKHGYGGIWGGKNASFHHNLLAHHDSRNPRFNGLRRSGLKYASTIDEEIVDFRNNVIYNWGAQSSYGGESGKYNIVANYFKAGPATKASARNRITSIDMDIAPDSCPPGFGSYFIDQNTVYGFPEVTSNNWLGVAVDKNIKSTTYKQERPFKTHTIVEQSADEAFCAVLKSAGASLVRDVVDERVVDEVRQGNARFKGSVDGVPGLIDSQKDVGGWPEYKSLPALPDSDNDGIPDGWLEHHYPSRKATDVDESGYTLLEKYLNSLVEKVVVL